MYDQIVSEFSCIGCGSKSNRISTRFNRLEQYSMFGKLGCKVMKSDRKNQKSWQFNEMVSANTGFPCCS